MSNGPETELRIVPSFFCDFPGCKHGSRPYKHKDYLARHQKSHDCQRHFICTAQECRYSFTRNYKLIDHIYAGHDDDTLFSCRRHASQILPTRDLVSCTPGNWMPWNIFVKAHSRSAAFAYVSLKTSPRRSSILCNSTYWKAMTTKAGSDLLDFSRKEDTTTRPVMYSVLFVTMSASSRHTETSRIT